MTASTKVLIAPVGVRGMKVLERDKFLRNYEVPVLKVSEENLSKIINTIKPYLLKLDNFKPLQEIKDENSGVMNKYIHLNPDKFRHWDDFTKEVQVALNKYNIDKIDFDTRTIQLSYENWRYDNIFKAIMPENEEIVSGFSQIGHIIHLNLCDHFLEFRTIVGQVLVDKIKTCRTVINKSNIIDNTFRNFSMEVIAGDEDFFVTVKENRCIFQFDFSKVYWNPRLGKEHERILGFLKPHDILFDVFCGVGPFAVPAAKRNSIVYANDLNPDSYKWLNHNAKHNKVKEAFFKSYNQDGKDFICGVFKDFLVDYCKDNKKICNGAKIHVTMNLPAMAVEFLKCFKGLIKDVSLMNKFNCEIIVYVYCFAIEINEPVDVVAKQMINDHFGCDMTPYILDIFNVRNVAPKKEMMRVTIKLSKEILFEVNSDIDEPPLKKLCVDNRHDKVL